MKRNRTKRFRATVYGEYVMDQFFFKVYTQSPKPDQIDLVKLQDEHIVPILHEYLHYLHEVSTHVGTVCLSYEVAFRSILSKYVVKNPLVSDFKIDWSQEDEDMLAYIDEGLNLIMGDTFDRIDGLGRNVETYQINPVTVHIPHENSVVPFDYGIPLLTVKDGESLNYLGFGKFFLYEGLAYELEMVFEQTTGRECLDEEDGTEYSMLGYFALHLMPMISRRATLTLASLSLSYINCGQMFVNFVLKHKAGMDKGTTETESLAQLKTHVSKTNDEHFKPLQGILKEITQLYKNRSALEATINDLERVYITAAKLRIQHSAIEVDMLYNGQFLQLLGQIPPCDYMFVFNDVEEYMRDFTGTSKFHQDGGMRLALDYQSFAAHIHYTNVLFLVAIIGPGDPPIDPEEICCPFYTSCDLRFRFESPEICRHTPWKTYDMASATDKLYCPYGTGVLLLKGQDSIAR